MKKYITKIKNIFLKKRSNNILGEYLEILVKHELSRKTAPHKYGLYIEEYLQEDNKRQLLKKEVENLLLAYPDSVLLIYMKVISLAKLGEFEEANKFISKEIIKSRLESKNYEKLIARKRTIALLKVWRVLDQIAREDMKWADGNNILETNYNAIDFISYSNQMDSSEFDYQLSLFFAEPYLQGKNIDEYLRVCRSVFEKCETVEEKLKVIFAIRRQGLRRINSYHEPYALAKDLYRDIREEIKLEIENKKKPEQVASLLRTVMNVSRALKLESDFKSAEEKLIKLALSPSGKDSIWIAAFALAEADPIKNYTISKEIINSSNEYPKKVSDIKNFLSWAVLVQEYSLAYRFFSKLPMKIKRNKIALVYVKILQRLGRFEEAKNISKEVHAGILVRSHNICPVTSWNLVKRTGELSFLAETSNIYSLVEQPKKPKGVVFITARSIDQLRKTPLVVFIELKRMGWAVIPLTKGLLPLEKTGINELDRFNGCLTLDREISKNVSKYFEDVKDFDFDILKGSLKWGEIDLSHIIWEEAAINRRVYNVDYSCPALNDYLSNVVKWTRQSVKVLHLAKKYSKNLDIPISFIIQFNARLPDAIYRFYCEKYGDAEKFFCLHSANGYQNYFSNFSTNISTKCIMRNMTRHPETRSGSFPVPKEFYKFYKKNKNNVYNMYEMVKDVTKVKRSTSGKTEIEQDAKLALLKIKEWKEKGGKVACAFGKVVYDSAVPYDGGPAHKNMKDWINHTIDCVKDSNTLLLVKPHPHELNQEISTFGNEIFFDLIETELNKNVILLGHKWFDMYMLEDLIDIGIIYNGTTSVELGILEIPSILCSYFAPIDYPIGHATPKNRKDYEKLVRFEKKICVLPDLKYRAAAWLYYMSGNYITLDYRYHSRPITNKVVYPPYWFKDDIINYFTTGDENVKKLVHRGLYE